MNRALGAALGALGLCCATVLLIVLMGNIRVGITERHQREMTCISHGGSSISRGGETLCIYPGAGPQ